jgi:glycosyltransferase involved in cell wall biosynthesis
MRIMMLSHGYPPTLSGVTLVVQKLSREMVRRGHEVLVLTASETRKPYQVVDEGVQVVRTRGIRNFFWSEGPIPTISLPDLRLWRDKFQPDIIHTHENAVLSVQLLRLPRDKEAARISSCYFLPEYVTHYLKSLPPVDKALQWFIWRYITTNLNRYDHVIFSTQTQQKIFEEHGLNARATSISNGVDNTRYMPGPEIMNGIVRKYNLPAGRRLLFVSRLMKDKRLDLLIQALPLIREKSPAHLVVVGRGDELANLQALAVEVGVADYVHFLGYVPESDLPEIYRACDIFAIASICEVQSIPALQAAATGLPIVAANAAALPELVSDEKNGYLVPPGDIRAIARAVNRILEDPERARQMGRESLRISRSHAERYTFDTYESLYQKLCNR